MSQVLHRAGRAVTRESVVQGHSQLHSKSEAFPSLSTGSNFPLFLVFAVVTEIVRYLTISRSLLQAIRLMTVSIISRERERLRQRQRKIVSLHTHSERERDRETQRENEKVESVLSWKRTSNLLPDTRKIKSTFHLLSHSGLEEKFPWIKKVQVYDRQKMKPVQLPLCFGCTLFAPIIYNTFIFHKILRCLW